jgi:hypothetical protein
LLSFFLVLNAIVRLPHRRHGIEIFLLKGSRSGTPPETPRSLVVGDNTITATSLCGFAAGAFPILVACQTAYMCVAIPVPYYRFGRTFTSGIGKI